MVVGIQGFENVYLRSPRRVLHPQFQISQKGKKERLLHSESKCCNVFGYNGSIPYFLYCLFLREK